MKKSFGPLTAFFPLPVVLIGTYDIDGKPNLMTAAWAGIVNSTPECLSISIRKERATHRGLELNKEFTLSFPNKQQCREVDHCGVFSHKTTDKILELGLIPKKSDIINAPEFDVFNVTICCRVAQQIDLGTHDLFISEIIDLKVDSSVLTDGSPDIVKIDPLMYDSVTQSYFSLGNRVAKAFAALKQIY